MKKLIITGFSICALAAGLTGCYPVNEAAYTGETVVGTGVGLVAGAGDVVVTTVGTGVGVLVGYPATQEDIIIYRTRGVVYHDGYAYRIYHGRYHAHHGRHHTALAGHHATKRDVRLSHKYGVVKHHGHTYRVQHGRYVLVR